MGQTLSYGGVHLDLAKNSAFQCKSLNLFNRSASQTASVWTFEEEEELRELYQQHKGSEGMGPIFLYSLKSLLCGSSI